MTDAHPTAAYTAVDAQRAVASVLTRGPWHVDHQHAGPPIAMACRAIERDAHVHGLTHLSRLTANLLRPVPIGELHVETATDYAGRNAGHFSARLHAQGKEVARITALMQRENPMPLPEKLPGHPLPQPPRGPDASPPAVFPFARPDRVGYADLVETHLAAGDFFKGPSAVWFRLRHPLVAGELPSAYQRVAVAADSGNGISAVLDFSNYLFLNSDLTIHLLRRPHGEWICLEARTHLGPEGCGLVESRLYDTQGLIGTAAQSLSVRRRD
ncbi:MAG: thioesterase family protein [Burkholderiaceae bacterium]